MSNWPSSTRAILASGQPRRPRTRASAWRWSSCQEPAKASFFYRVDGLWNGSSPGLPGSVASPGTMKDCRKPWKDCTSSLSPASCSPEAAVSSHSSLQALRRQAMGLEQFLKIIFNLLKLQFWVFLQIFNIFRWGFGYVKAHSPAGSYFIPPASRYEHTH